MAWGQKWGQQSVMELDNRGADLKIGYHDIAKKEESYNVGSQGIPSGNYPPLAMMKPGYGGTPPDKPRSHEHFAGEFPGQGKQPATTTMDTEAYQKLRNRGLTDAQSRHALLLMQSTGVPVEQLQTAGLMAIPQLGEEGRPVTSGAGTHGHYPGDPEAQTSGHSRNRAGAALGIGGAAAAGIGGMAMMGHATGQHAPLPKPTPMTPATQLSGPRVQTSQQLQQQALMQARQSVGAPVTGRPSLRTPGMHGQAVISPTGLAQSTGQPIVPPHREDQGNEILNPDGTIETGRAGDAIRLRASFRKFGQKKVVETNGSQ